MDVLPVLVSIRLNSSTYILPLFGKIYNRKTDYFDFFCFYNNRKGLAGRFFVNPTEDKCLHLVRRIRGEKVNRFFSFV